MHFSWPHTVHRPGGMLNIAAASMPFLLPVETGGVRPVLCEDEYIEGVIMLVLSPCTIQVREHRVCVKIRWRNTGDRTHTHE